MVDLASRDIQTIMNFPEVAEALLRLLENAAAAEHEQAQSLAFQAVLDDSVKIEALRHMGRCSAFRDLKELLMKDRVAV